MVSVPGVYQWRGGIYCCVFQIQSCEFSSLNRTRLSHSQGLQSLIKRMQAGNFRLDEPQVTSLLSSLLCTVAYLHSRGIAHRDIKPSNIVIRDPANLTDVVLLDFGSSFSTNSTEASDGYAENGAPMPNFGAMQTLCGTPFYLAPELVLGHQYTEKVDIWAIGCLAFQLLTGHTPFEKSRSFEELYSKIAGADFQFPSNDTDHPPISEEARSFTTSLLALDPRQRPSAGQALVHPWLTSGLRENPRVEEIRATGLQRERALSGFSVEFDSETGSLTPVFAARSAEF